MPKVTIDGVEIEVEAGTTILQAALQQGAVVPHYCYHPGLTIAGNCRMCLVEVEKAPKLVIGCATPVADGMVVNTRNDRVQEAQAAVMEFLLVNHPLDCTICDQAGECRLQEYAVEYGTGKSRLESPKVLQNKAVDIGKHVMLDQERCIQCSRCTRFCDEVTKTGELNFFQRGEKTIIGVYPGKKLDNPYSGNTVDICPVGALTLKEFRFETRVWYLKNTPSICAGCSRGCNVMVARGVQQEQWTSPGQFDDRIKRMVPRYNPEVNGHWMCDEGRLSFMRAAEASPLMQAEAPSGAPVEWEDAVKTAADAIKQAADAGRLGAIVSPRMTTESMYAWSRVFEGLGGAEVGVHVLESGADDELLIRANKGANAKGAEWVFGGGAAPSNVDTLIVFGDPLDPADTAPAGAGAKTVIYVGPYRHSTAESAAVVLPTCAWAEEDGSFVNFEGRIQWTRKAHRPRGEGRPGWLVAREVAAAAGVELPEWDSSEAVLADVGASVPAYRNVDIDSIGLLGVAGAASPVG